MPAELSMQTLLNIFRWWIQEEPKSKPREGTITNKADSWKPTKISIREQENCKGYSPIHLINTHFYTQCYRDKNMWHVVPYPSRAHLLAWGYCSVPLWSDLRLMQKRWELCLLLKLKIEVISTFEIMNYFDIQGNYRGRVIWVSLQICTSLTSTR